MHTYFYVIARTIYLLLGEVIMTKGWVLGTSVIQSVAKKAAYALVLSIAVLSLCVPMFSQGAQATIQGAVFDQSGGAVAGATVSVVDVERGVTRTLITSSAGEYVATSLTPGTYTVRGEAKGFRTVEHSGVRAEVGQTIRVDLVVQPGEQTQTITVTGEVPDIDTTSATLGGTVSNNTILTLPLNGRNFFRLLQLRPGVVTNPGDPSGASSTNGRRVGADLLLVEGIPQIDMATANTLINGNYKGGDSSSLLPIDAIQEFNTQQNAPAEYGWRDGSVVNVGIRSGTNTIHGTAYAFGRDAQATDAANAFTHAVTPATLEQFGATAGGPILKDKLFWFVSFEGLRINLGSVTQVTIPASVSVGNPALSLVDACRALGPAKINALSARLSGLDPTTCVVSPASATVENLFPFNTTGLSPVGSPTSQPLNNGLAKFDWNPGPHHHINATYYVSKSTQIGSGQLEPDWALNVDNDTETYAGSWIWTPNSTWVNDVRVGYAFANLQAIYGDINKNPADPWPTGYGINTGVTNPLYFGMPSVILSSFTGVLGANARPGRRGPNGQVEFKDTVSYLRGKHAFKFGVEHVLVVFDDAQLVQSQGVIRFTSLQNFLTGTSSTANILTGNPAERLRANWFSGFIQDDWRVTSRLTVNPGLALRVLRSSARTE